MVTARLLAQTAASSLSASQAFLSHVVDSCSRGDSEMHQAMADADEELGVNRRNTPDILRLMQEVLKITSPAADGE